MVAAAVMPVATNFGNSHDRNDPSDKSSPTDSDTDAL
jgi:hypothetical protein